MAGPPGLGKTTLAMIVANELGVPIRVTSGPAIQHAGDLASILSSLDVGEVLFIDEIHRLPRAAEELLYIAMEDFRVDVMVGKVWRFFHSIDAASVHRHRSHHSRRHAPFAPARPIRLHRALWISTLMRNWKTHRTLRLRAWPPIEDQAARQLSLRSRGTPRIANRLLRRVRDWAIVHDLDSVGADDVKDALALYQIDSEGLDRLDIAVLNAIVRQFHGGPVGLNNLSAMVGRRPRQWRLYANRIWYAKAS